MYECVHRAQYARPKNGRSCGHNGIECNCDAIHRYLWNDVGQGLRSPKINISFCMRRMSNSATQPAMAIWPEWLSLFFSFVSANGSPNEHFIKCVAFVKCSFWFWVSICQMVTTSVKANGFDLISFIRMCHITRTRSSFSDFSRLSRRSHMVRSLVCSCVTWFAQKNAPENAAKAMNWPEIESISLPCLTSI